MNSLTGKIVKIASSGEIGQVHVDVNGAIFTSILLDVNSFGITIEESVKLLFKANEVLIATKESQVSAKNAFLGKVIKIEQGLILSEVSLEFQDQFYKINNYYKLFANFEYKRRYDFFMVCKSQ
ncbi:MAG: hypothetical protein U5K55_09225 [Aliarcobacter sp.]|nr:hypothetical protein [Aliarcobacter sp.]